jgi:ribonuclease P protein component
LILSGAPVLARFSGDFLEEPSEQPPGKPAPAPERLRRRSDFLNAAKGNRFHAKGFVLQAAPRQSDVKTRRKVAAPRQSEMGAPDRAGTDGLEIVGLETAANARFGVTVTKKIGGAPTRNRIRRRLKEALRLLAPLPAQASHDYVIVARPEALRMPFGAMQAELQRAIAKIGAAGKPAKSRQDSRQDKRQDVQQGLQRHKSVGKSAAGPVAARAETSPDRTPMA